MAEATTPSNLTRIKDLPIYGSPTPPNKPKLVEQRPLPLQHEIAVIRYAFSDNYQVLANRFRPIDRAVQSTKRAVIATDEYLRNEGTVLPKAAAITVGGMAGFVIGLRRYGIRKFVYATTGLLTMAAFCYPHEAIEISQIGMAHTQQAWENFKASPPMSKK